MNKLRVIALTAFGLFALETNAQESPAPEIVNVFACQLNEGKTIDNVWSTLEALAKMNVPSKTPPDPNGTVFLWTPFRTGAPYDYIWGYTNSTLNSMSSALIDYVAAPGVEAMEAQFDATGTCISMIATSQAVRTGALGTVADRNRDAIVETLACDYADGAGSKQRDETVALWQREFEKIKSPALKTYAAWTWSPYRGGTGESDWFWIGAYPDLKNWAQGETDYYASKEGAAIDAQFSAMGTCHGNLWIGYWIVAPTTVN